MRQNTRKTNKVFGLSTGSIGVICILCVCLAAAAQIGRPSASPSAPPTAPLSSPPTKSPILIGPSDTPEAAATDTDTAQFNVDETGANGNLAPTSAAPTLTAGCNPTDQDQYIYHPSRLQVLAACIRVTGTIDAIKNEADGDLHIRLRLDRSFTGLLTAANSDQYGDMVVEPVCFHSATQADAVDICQSDPDPFQGPLPSVGQHIWMEGRYVLDLQHGAWAELHPLYRWGDLGGGILPPVDTAVVVPAVAPTDTPAIVVPTEAQVIVVPTDTQAPLPTAPPAVSGFSLLSLTSPVNVNGYASATIQTAPGASCYISYVTPHGTQSVAQGLVPKTADGNGNCSWTWKIGSRTKPGIGTVTITAGGATQSFPIEIQ